ncbi:hypothetical protein BAU08_21415 [Bordetella bronchialis]|uniref:Uncharacterized protein n=1 Tax=Bordetella bronchialis TaxID=463025 RepID=A0A193FKZ0_9BORD|nr:hypothetical protein BAU06_20885 [Bordetella bronchialis]ANN73568.1 hypothetical protein BAU08_21415 [Bordetella bronchialis]
MRFAPGQGEHRLHGHAGQEAAARALAVGAAFGQHIGLADILQPLDPHAHQRHLREGRAHVVIDPYHLARVAIGADHAAHPPARGRRGRILHGHPLAAGADLAQPADRAIGRLRLQDAARLDLPAGQDVLDHIAVES